MIKTLMGSIRDYMKVAVATPLLVLGEVLCEMLIPFITANLIDAIKDGATVAEMLPTAGLLVLIALTSLAFGAAAGVTCSHASCGFAKNLRHDLFYKIQTFSFANIDEFSSSSLVTRLTTDINNVQQAFMMIIRIAVRAPLVLIFAFTMAFIMGGSVAMVYLVIIPLLGFGLFFIIYKVRPIFCPRVPQVRRAQRVRRGKRHRHARGQELRAPGLREREVRHRRARRPDGLHPRRKAARLQ